MWISTSTTTDYKTAEDVEFDCIENADLEDDRCGRTCYLRFVTFEAGQELEPPGSSVGDDPSFDFFW